MNPFLRLVFPSWAFFDQPGHMARWEFRASEAEPWVAWPSKIERQWYQLFFNPQGNWYLYRQQLAQQLLIESQEEHFELHKSETYLMLSHLFLEDLESKKRYEIRLVATDWKSEKSETIFTSILNDSPKESE